MSYSRQIRVALATVLAASLITIPALSSHAGTTSNTNNNAAVAIAANYTAVARYTVAGGDTLSKIARAKCNRVSAWRSLWSGNPEIKNPNRIYVGQRIRLTCTATTPVASVRSTSSSRIQTVVAFAMAQRGKPYRWGAAGPNAYDCSGLVMASFKRVGVRLPHQTGAMLSYGRKVSRSSLRVGDVVWMTRGHVGIYIGKNKVVVAPQAGQRVRTQTIYAFYTARRMIA